MPDPVVGKAGSAIAHIGPKEAAIEAEKKGPSKFDRVQGEIASGQEQASPMPPPVEGVSDAQRKELIGEVRRKMEANPAGDPKQVFGPEMKETETGVARLRHRVQQLPPSSEVHGRLEQIEAQFRNAQSALDKLPDMTDPRSLLKMQIEMYTMSQNIELVSKAVEQVNSGVKTVMQTNV